MKAESKKEYKAEQSRSRTPPLDVNLDSRLLWKEGVELSQSGMFEDAAWRFLVALFMSAELDANDKKPVKVAVEGCSDDNPVAKVLSAILVGKGLRAYSNIYEWAAKRTSTKSADMSISIDEVDRDNFALGMSRVMYARKIGFAFQCRTAADARRTENKVAFDEAAKLIQEASFYIDPQRWLTMQFEMGYSSMDVGAVNEAEKWLKQFTNNLEKTTSLRSDKGAIRHWSGMKSSADSRLAQLPLLKSIRLQNPGFLQPGEAGGEECILM